jgi:iron complex transport system ATP-binding protein
MLEAKNITVNYGPQEVVSAVSLRANPGEIIAIIGPNGAGKSTLLRTLNASLRATRGEILLDGTPLASFARRSIARRIAVVAQEADLRFPVSVMEFVLGGRYAWSSAWGWESQRDVEIARGILRETELESFEARLMNELSGGERQRAVLARALATSLPFFSSNTRSANSAARFTS